MILDLPTCISYSQATRRKGIYEFHGVICYGDPIYGPWLEVYDNGKIRKFEDCEMPVGGYSSVSSQIARIAELAPEPSANELLHKIDTMLNNNDIKFQPS